MQINFNNGSIIKPISPLNKLFKDKNKRSKNSEYTTYYCGLCDTMHQKLYTDSYYVDGRWYCRDAWDKL